VSEPQNVDVPEARSNLSQGAKLLDVRELDEWSNGHAPEAVHVPLAELPDRLGELSKDRLTICACRSGARSARAAHFLAEQGYDVVNLEGGMLAWQAQAGPLVADHGEPEVK